MVSSIDGTDGGIPKFVISINDNVETISVKLPSIGELACTVKLVSHKTVDISLSRVAYQERRH